MEKILCAVCNTSLAVKVKKSFSAKYNQTMICLENVEMYECSACGEQFFSPEQAKNVSHMVKAKAREQLGLLPPERIIKIRNRYNLSQEDIEAILGLGPKVVTRWERGKVLQGKAADVVLRLMERFPDTVDKLKEIRQQIS